MVVPESVVPDSRIRLARDAPPEPEGDYVLYWMTSQRRVEWNFALDRALEWARHVGRPLVVFEALRVGYRWASDRFHHFVVEGMREHAADLAASPLTYLHYVEREPNAGKGLLRALAERAVVVVGDEYPAFFLPRMLEAAARQVPGRLELVDSHGLLPLALPGEVFGTAYAFRRYLQKTLPEHLPARPAAAPDFDGLAVLGDMPDAVERWAPGFTLPDGDAWKELPIDHGIGRVGGGPSYQGGSAPARALLHAFLSEGLAGYPENRRHPDRGGSSRLSAHLHWGHISTHEIVHTLFEAQGWTPLRLSDDARGKRKGWWGLSEGAEAFLDELVTWRELAFNTCAHLPDYDSYDTLPRWARETLEAHADDPRPQVYSLEELEGAATHDELWNAAQRELVREGRIHNYLRMLWGKKILEWTRNPKEALQIMIELNNKYGLDGRDPNSYGGIFWVLGRYDRGWPERAVYGKVRSMTSASTRRKVDVDAYVARHGAELER